MFSHRRIAAYLVLAVLAVSGAGAQEPARTVDIAAERARILAELERRGGWDAWKRAVEPYWKDLRVVLTDMQGAGDQLRDFEGYLFGTFDVSYVLSDSFVRAKDPAGADSPSKQFSIVVDFHEQLKQRGIDLIFVPIPPRSELFPTALAASAPGREISVAPQRSEFMLALLEAGVETIDLYPGLIAEQQRTGDTLCLKDDSHWNHLGIAEGARQVAARLKRYEFVSGPDAPKRKYTTKTIQTDRRGNLVGHFPEAEQAKYPPTIWTFDQVQDENGVPYEDDETSPILIAGDSYTYLLADDHAGISAHIAKEIGMPLARMSSPRGGPGVPRALARQGKEYIDQRRVIIWMMVARYLAHSRVEDWQTATLP